MSSGGGSKGSPEGASLLGGLLQRSDVVFRRLQSAVVKAAKPVVDNPPKFYHHIFDKWDSKFLSEYPGLAAGSRRCTWRLGCLLMQCSMLSYEEKGAAVDAHFRSSSGFRVRHFEVINNRDFEVSPPIDTQFFVARDASNVIVAFRGSAPDHFIPDLFLDGHGDWVTGMRSKLVPLDLYMETIPAHCKVHSGFASALFRCGASGPSAWELLVAELNSYQQSLAPGKKLNLYITGHSLGGALAMLCGMALQERKLAHGEFQHLNLRAVVTFGQPRVGNADMCTVVDSTLRVPLLRIVHKDDLVSRIPSLRALPPGLDLFIHSIDDWESFAGGGGLLWHCHVRTSSRRRRSPAASSSSSLSSSPSAAAAAAGGGAGAGAKGEEEGGTGSAEGGVEIGAVVHQLHSDALLEFPSSGNPLEGYFQLLPRLVDHLPGRYLALMEWETPVFRRGSHPAGEGTRSSGSEEEEDDDDDPPAVPVGWNAKL